MFEPKTDTSTEVMPLTGIAYWATSGMSKEYDFLRLEYFGIKYSDVYPKDKRRAASEGSDSETASETDSETGSETESETASDSQSDSETDTEPDKTGGEPEESRFRRTSRLLIKNRCAPSSSYKFPAPDWTHLDAQIAKTQERGNALILRIGDMGSPSEKETYVPHFIKARGDYKEVKSNDGRHHYPDWTNATYQAFVLEFVRHLAERYNGNNGIAYLQVGFGFWSEFHLYGGQMSRGVTFPSPEFVEQYLAQCKASLKIPFAISNDALTQGVASGTDFGYGVFSDTLLDKRRETIEYITRMFDGFVVDERAQSQAIGGEFSNSPESLNSSSDMVRFEDCAKLWWLTYAMGNGVFKNSKKERIRTASAMMGYRLKLKDKLKKDTAASSVTLVNYGNAAVYHDAYLVCNGQTIKTANLKLLLPGAEIKIKLDKPVVVDDMYVLIQGQKAPIFKP